MSSSGGLRAVLSRIFRVLFWPIAVALDPRLRTLEHRLVLRMDRLENHVATDAEVAAELAVTQSRTLGRLEERLREAEAAARGGGAHDLEAAWAISALASLAPPARVLVDHGDEGPVALTLAALGHEVYAAGHGGEGTPAHPRVHRSPSLSEALHDAGGVEAAVLLTPRCGGASAGPAALPAIAGALHDPGLLLIALDGGAGLPAGWRVQSSSLLTARGGAPEWVVDASADERPGTRLVRALLER